MSKTHKIDVRLSADELAEIERAARVLNMPKSQYARLLLTGGAVQNQQPAAPAPAAQIDETALADMRAELAEMRESLVASAAAFDQLLSFLKEQQRIPSFREYRARAAVENIARRENESEQQYLQRLASRYFVVYQQWPLPSDSATFGPVPQGFEPQKWPATPPR
jgi:Xaa-Pro aminopeptidase